MRIQKLPNRIHCGSFPLALYTPSCSQSAGHPLHGGSCKETLIKFAPLISRKVISKNLTLRDDQWHITAEWKGDKTYASVR
jgi:hypothetical protein